MSNAHGTGTSLHSCASAIHLLQTSLINSGYLFHWASDMGSGSFSTLYPRKPLKMNRNWQESWQIFATSILVTQKRPELQSHQSFCVDRNPVMSYFRTVAFHANYRPNRECLSLLSREWALVMIFLGEDDTGQNFTRDPGAVAQGWVSRCQGHVSSVHWACTWSLSFNWGLKKIFFLSFFFFGLFFSSLFLNFIF